jgi:hypothetical protein
VSAEHAIEGVYGPQGAATRVEPPDPGPFGIDADEYTDRDRTMFVLGYEWAGLEGDLRASLSGGPGPLCRTIHAENWTRAWRLLHHAGFEGKAGFKDLGDGWIRMHATREP